MSAISVSPSASPLPSSYHYRPSLRSRAASLGLTLAMFALIVFILLRMAAWHAGPGAAAEKLVAVRLSAKSADARKQQSKAKARQAATQPQPPRPTAQPSPQPVVPLNIIKLSRAEYAASDISKMARQPAGDSSASQDSGAAAGPGEGPGGAHLYNAEWHREPTHAEMVTYMPVGGGPPGSWGMIACRTIERNRVEDCRELAESPPGSGLARALRRASWQFLVRPPRVDGRKLIGSWVRIRFDFIKTKEE